MNDVDLSKCSDDDLIRLVKAVEIKNTRVHFAKNCHRNTKGERLEFSRFRHMLDLYNSVSPHIVIVGAAQVGKTDWLIVDTFAASYNNLSVFFVLPKVDFLIAYSKEKIKKPLSLSPEYKLLNKESISESIQFLQFGSGLIKIVGGNVPSDFTSFSADCLDGDSLITTTLGDIRIKDLHRYVRQDIILSSDSEGHYHTNRLTCWMKKEPKWVNRYVFSNGKYLDATPDHKIWTSVGWLPIEVAATQLRSLAVGTFQMPVVFITSVEPVGVKEVFDISVENDHSFFANGVKVHNCYTIDEIDKCDSMDNIELGYSRLQGSIYKFTRIVSNPTTKEAPIWQHFLNSDQKVWKCPCQECGEFSEINWFASIVNEVEDGAGNVISHILRDTEWRVGCGRDIYIKCPKPECTGNIDRFHPDCFWEAQNPESKISGFHMPSLISPLSSVEQGWAEYSNGLQNPSKMAKFYSMFLALPYAPVGSKITTNLLFNCVGKTPAAQFSVSCQLPDHAAIPQGTHKGPCSMGIDTSPNHIDIRISSNESGKRKMVYVGKIDCQGQSVDFVEARLHNLVELYNVNCAVIDIGPEKLLAMGFAKNAKCPVWLCKFLGRGEERLMKYNYGDMIISIDRTEALDRTYAQLKTAKNLLPTNYPYIMQGAYVSEMTALVREVSEDSKGNIRYSWTKGTDHAFLADTYDILAFDIIQEDVITGEQCIFVG